MPPSILRITATTFSFLLEEFRDCCNICKDIHQLKIKENIINLDMSKAITVRQRVMV